MTAAASSEQTLEDRYGTGRTRRFDRRFAWSAVAVLLLGGIAFLLFSGWHKTSEVSFQDIGFDRVDDYSATVKFEMGVAPNTPVACALEALSESKANVGWKILEVPASEQRLRHITADIATTSSPATVYVRDCWVMTSREQ